MCCAERESQRVILAAMQLKGLERVGKRLATRAIAAFMGPPPKSGVRGARPDWRDRQYRVLFLRHDRIGDMNLTTGVLRAIAESHPTIQLDVLASTINAPVLRNESYVHEVIPFDRNAPLAFPRVARELRRRQYDAVIDCMVTAPSLTTLLLMLASGARHRIGVAERGNDFAYTLPVPSRDNATHIVDKLGALVTAFGLQPTACDLRPRLHLTAEERAWGERAWAAAGSEGERHRPRVLRLLVNVSAGRAFRFWPNERFVDVIRRARARHSAIDVVLIASPNEAERARQIANATSTVWVATPSVRDAFALVATSDAVFTPDTSIAHAATAFEKSAVVMFVRHMSALWAPYRAAAGTTLESATDTLEPISADLAADALLRVLDAASFGAARRDA